MVQTLVLYHSISVTDLVLSFFCLINQLISLSRFSKKIRKVITHFFRIGGKDYIYLVSDWVAGGQSKKPTTMGIARA